MARARRIQGITQKYRNVNGLADLVAKLDELSAINDKGSEIRYDVRGVLQKGGSHIRDAAIRYAPARPSNISQAIVSAFGKDKRQDATTVVMALFKKSPWWHWWEFGTGPRFTKSGAFRGAIPAVKFLRRGTAAARPKVAAEVAQGLREVITKYSK